MSGGIGGGFSPGGVIRLAVHTVPSEPVSAEPDPWDAETVAEQRGCHVVYPDPDQVQLDIDTDEQYQVFLRRKQDWASLERHYDVPKWLGSATTTSQNGNKHITVTFDRNLDHRERVLMQMALGSDPIREQLNYFRILRGEENPSRLFEPNE